MMNAQMIPGNRTTNKDRMYIAFEFSNTKWKLMFGNGVKRRHKTIEARDLGRLEEEIAKSRKRFKMSDDVERNRGSARQGTSMYVHDDRIGLVVDTLSTPKPD